MQLDGQRVLLESPRHGKAAAPDGVVEAAHMPADGHGEKSVFLIERFMKLKVEEAVAIRWHMGGFDDAAKGGCFAISEAYDKYPLAVKLHIADLEATYLMEHRTSSVR